MSLLDDLQSRLTSDAVLQMIGTVVMRIDAEGVSYEPITAFFQEQNSDREVDVGERGVRTAVLEIKRDVEVARGDQWNVADELWQLHPREWLGNTSGAFRRILLRRDEKTSTRKNTGKYI